MDEEGNPQFVEGQANVIGVIPGDEGYSDFWAVNLVTVPEDYEANSITSVQGVIDSGYEIAQPGLVVNCPVLRTDDAAAGDGNGDQAMMPASGAQLPPVTLIVAVAAAVLGLMALIAALFVTRRARQ